MWLLLFNLVFIVIISLYCMSSKDRFLNHVYLSCFYGLVVVRYNRNRESWINDLAVKR